MRIAVIDLGTNTCNLLVAEINHPGFEILHQSKQLVRLGDGKIRDNEISAGATGRVLEAFRVQKAIVEKFQAEKTMVIATSAVRDANNKNGFLQKIKDETGWEPDVVSGEKEAELIFKGVLLAVNRFRQPAVILDIGGGSNETIIANNREMLWKESQPAGMARVINRFELSDPVSETQIATLQRYFAEAHRNAILRCRRENVKTLAGCSGAFDTIADILDGVNPGEKQRRMQEITPDEFFMVYRKLIASSRQERLAMKGMDFVRVDLIVPAVILIERLITEVGIEKIILTDFALREGVLYELMHV